MLTGWVLGLARRVVFLGLLKGLQKARTGVDMPAVLSRRNGGTHEQPERESAEAH